MKQDSSRHNDRDEKSAEDAALAGDHDLPALEKMVRFNELLDAYGALLTDRQLRLAKKHFQEDLSFGEIAREEGVSRQAAHDAVKQAGLALERLDAHLGLVSDGGRTVDLDALTRGMADLAERLRAMDGPMVDRQWALAEVESLMALMSGRVAAPSGKEEEASE